MKESLSEERIKEIRERVGKASPAKWVTIGTSSSNLPGRGISSQRGDGTSFRVANTDIDDLSHDEQNANGLFIAHARQDIPDLLDEVERLRQPSVPIDQATCDHEFQEVCLRCGKDCAEWAWESHQKDVAGAHRIRRSE